MDDEISLASLFLQCFSAVLSLLVMGKFKTFSYKVLSFILCLTAIVELLGFYNITINKSGLNLYVFYGFFLFNLISLFYKRVLDFKVRKKILLALMILFNISVILTFLNIISLNYLIMTGSIIASIYSFLYLRKLLISDNIIVYSKVLPFWISVGFLVFYLPAIPFFSLLKYMTSRGLFFILDVLIIIMNLIIIYGLITCSKEEKY